MPQTAPELHYFNEILTAGSGRIVKIGKIYGKSFLRLFMGFFCFHFLLIDRPIPMWGVNPKELIKPEIVSVFVV